MSEWEVIPFGQLYKIPSRNGVSRSSILNGEGTRIINMGELFAFPRLKNPEMRRVISNEKEDKLFGLQKDDLLFARRSLIPSGAGKCSIVLEVEVPTVFESSIIRVRLDKTKCSPLFFYYYFTSQIGFGAIQTLVNEVAASGIRSSELAKLKVINPKLSVQKQIASILSTYDELIENNNRRIAILEQTAEQIYKEWFVRMRFPGYENTEFEKGVPKGWEIAPLGSISNILMGQSPKSEYYNQDGVGLPFHQGVGSYGKRFPKHETFCSVKGRLAQQNDILFSVRAPVGRINLADTKLIIGRGLASIRHKKGLQSYLFYLLNYYFQLEDIIGNGSIFNSVGKEELNKFKILQPDDELDKKFNDFIFPIDNQLNNLLRQNQNLKQTRDLLLPRLISGKLRVKEILTPSFRAGNMNASNNKGFSPDKV